MAKLNTEKIRNELFKIKRRPAWLAEEVGVSSQTMSYRLQTNSLIDIEKMAEILNIEPDELIVFEDLELKSFNLDN